MLFWTSGALMLNVICYMICLSSLPRALRAEMLTRFAIIRPVTKLSESNFLWISYGES